jgi:ABC-type glutathione transport system ATPase component
LTSGNLGLAKAQCLFQVSGLSVEYHAAGGDLVRALRNVDLEIAPGRTVGILGESGSGKSSLALALMRLLPPNARISAGSVDYRGQSLAGMPPGKLRAMRGGEVALISQEPALALNPVIPTGTQLKDVLKAHCSLDRHQIEESCKSILRDVGFADPERIMRAYPHQLSGGQRQRVAIAQALVCRPQLLIADEPLSSLDAATQAEIVELLERLKRELGLAMLFITHNAGVLWSLADQIMVMRQGEIVARGSVNELQRSPDSYLRGVLFPENSLFSATGEQKSRSEAPLLEIRALSKRFVQQRVFSRKKFVVQGLEKVNLELAQGSTVALIGRSGSGKSTLARCIAGFETPDSGEIFLEGKKRDLGSRSRTSVREWAKVQMIFQDAATSVNPRFTAQQVIAEPLDIARWDTDLDRRTRALELMQEVGLAPEWAGRLAGEFSGGQRQRLALARAIAAEPRLLILDEALSALDLPLQAQMLQLLMDLQARHGLTYLYISHDLNFVSLFAKKIVVMEAGRIVEQLAPSQLPQSKEPATRTLLQAGGQLHAPGVETIV